MSIPIRDTEPNEVSLGGYQKPVNTNYSRPNFGINPFDKNFASKVNAQLARKDWEDYKRTYMPIHQEFKNMVMSDTLVNEQLGRTQGNVDNAYARQQQAADSRMQRMGLAEADMGRVDMNKALSVASAENNIRTSGKDRSLAAIAGAPMPTAGA